MLGISRENDCIVCGDIDPVAEPELNLQVTRLDVNEFPLWSKFFLALLQQAPFYLESAFLWAVLLYTSAVVFVPSVGQSFDQTFRFLGGASASTPSAESKVSSNSSNSTKPSLTPVKKSGNFKLSSALAASPTKGDQVLSYPVTSPFGHRLSPVSGASTEHKGVDIATPEGTPVFTIGLPGTKTKVLCKWNEHGGNEGFQQPGGMPDKEFVTVHMKSCKSGIYESGKAYGLTGNTGSATEGPHLHFEEHTLINGISTPVPPSKGYAVWVLQGTSPVLPVQPPASGVKISAAPSPVNATEAYQKALPSVVRVLNGKEGTGFVMSKDGKVLTNYHVISDNDPPTAKLRDQNKLPHTVQFSDGKSYEFKVIKVDRTLDMAMLQIQAPGIDFTPIALATDRPKINDEVFVISNLEGSFPTSTHGNILSITTVANIDAEIEVSTGLIRPGSSGSPLLNAAGELIGQNKAALTPFKGREARGQARNGNGLATPLQQLLDFFRHD